MKIILIGATGTIGRAVAEALGQRHDIISVGKTHGQYQVDVTRSDSIRALFEQVGKVDAIVSTTGALHFGPLSEMTAEQFKIGLHNKLLGQVDLALIGQHYVNAGGSITLTSGIVSQRISRELRHRRLRARRSS
jgi:NAD(P)-dependent dehydrogenase (short-subunit alcohol dehydrogenase family)